MNQSALLKTPTPQFKNCLFEAHKIPPEQFRLPDDGRKWKVNTFNRRTLFLELASFGDANGANVRPSIPTLMQRTGFCRSKVFNLLDDLKTLGFWEKAGRHGWNGQTIRQLKMSEKPTETPSGSPSFESGASVGVHDSGVEVHDSTVEVHDSTVGVHDSRVEVHPRVDSTCPSDLPIRPAFQPSKKSAVRNTDELRDGMVKTFSKARPEEKLSWTGFVDIEHLAAEFGNESVCKVWKRWLKDRNTYGMKLHFRWFCKEFDTARADLERIEREEKAFEKAKAETFALDDAQYKREREAIELKLAEDKADAAKGTEGLFG